MWVYDDKGMTQTVPASCQVDPLATRVWQPDESLGTRRRVWAEPKDAQQIMNGLVNELEHKRPLVIIS